MCSFRGRLDHRRMDERIPFLRPFASRYRPSSLQLVRRSRRHYLCLGNIRLSHHSGRGRRSCRRLTAHLVNRHGRKLDPRIRCTYTKDLPRKPLHYKALLRQHHRGKHRPIGLIRMASIRIPEDRSRQARRIFDNSLDLESTHTPNLPDSGFQSSHRFR